MFENRVLQRIFGHKRDDVTEEWRQLHDEEIYDLYCSPNVSWVIKSRRMNWVGQVAHRVEKRGVNRVLVGRPEGKRPIGRLICRWDLNESLRSGIGGMNWIDQAQDKGSWRALVNAVMNLWVSFIHTYIHTYIYIHFFFYFPLDLYRCGSSHNYIKMKYAEHLSQYNSNVNAYKINTI